MTMIGFAKRAGKIVYGYDGLAASQKVKLAAVSDTASDNLKRNVALLAERRNYPLVTAALLEQKVGNNIKALGILDENMAKAVSDYVRSGAEGYSIEYGTRR